MNRILNKMLVKYRKGMVTVAIAVASSNALALGGLDKATETADDIRVWLYALVGVLSTIYLIYLGVMAFTEKKSWADFGWGVVYVSLVGASVAIANWAWKLFA
ncbi:TrbC/VirB2 family protein (plasmid) [Xylella taiwanensis]|uniref:TrbC/VirB2 family protein n=1 Tax=Xylella taiwanensis TaxID=1444770 RepID=A0ABS8TZ91_9GAMM|nr:TrbC/VirB2 family protein [Xylella taiwanensis]MCD8459779.1 TrbC/VirB2 family protein [Xylella taiwanensis]MCD8474168.1 TrbC/VirB2 family protein [Xylella taiwanensis]UFN08048.1 TrbC/VirB2 family protein [Xylella taiwanensis]UFN10341.1 TrbC/VirB2 family protein [Xylella taiwanensis]UFN12629.1 TrbC/VirB2 family protein [Xylella taiwanensis]